MVSSRRRLDLEQAHPLLDRNTPKNQTGFLGAGTARRCQARTEVRSFDIADQLPFPCRATPDNGEIRLASASQTELRGKPRRSLGRTREEHDAGHGAIEAVDKTEKDIPRFFVFLFEVVLRDIEQGPVAGAISLHENPRRLVDTQQVIVFQKNPELWSIPPNHGLHSKAVRWHDAVQETVTLAGGISRHAGIVATWYPKGVVCGNQDKPELTALNPDCYTDRRIGSRPYPNPKDDLMRKWSAPVIGSIALLWIVACGSNESTSDKNDVATIATDVSPEQLKRHIQYLASDELIGRGPGTKGEELTLIYLSEQYANLGLRPGNPDGSYIQAVPLVGSIVTNKPTLTLEAAGETIHYDYGDEFMAWTLRRQEHAAVHDAELVFVGYGAFAPEYNWDDYKGLDVSGKILVMLVGDPPLPDTTLFGGKAMTYYGRWTYKYEIAAQKGAAGAIIIHKAETAGYPWEVVSNSWSGEQFDIEREDNGMGRCAVEGWITTPVAEEIFSRAGLPLDEAYKQAVSNEFTPVPLGITASVAVDLQFRELRSYNVVARLEGSDPELKKEHIIYCAHWDHLGIGTPSDGDSIYNGALDNASGVAATLEIARLFVENQEKMKRSVLFLNTTAEESGLLGSFYYAENPLYPLNRTVAAINIDGLNIWGRTTDMVVVGRGASDLDGYLAKAVASQDREIRPDAEPEKGYYYRSDHFPFAKKGVPSLYSDSGVQFRSRPPRWGLGVRQQYTSERYHKPSDEYQETWDLTGAVEDIEALFRVGLMIASSDDWPAWSDTSEFKRIREMSLQGGR